MAGQAIVLLMVIAALSQSGDAATQAPKARVESGPHASRFAAGVGCVIFNDQAEFETFNEERGGRLKGIETFEESILVYGGFDAFDDSLCGGLPSVPDGYPFPKGLDELNVCVQSNFRHNPATPNPRGVEGLFAVAAPRFGAASDVVVANFFFDSFDLIFSEPDHIGVGINTISFSGGDNVEIRAYDKAGQLLISFAAAADTVGVNFGGVWCNQPIRRINIFDTGNGAEGGDNIQMWVSGVDCGDCPTDVDGSGGIGAADLAVLLGSWGPCAPGQECACLDADDDDIIGPFDLAVLLGAWGPCP